MCVYLNLCYCLTFQLRLYSVAIQDTEIAQHIGYVTLERPVWKYYGSLHFRMEDSSGTTTLTNSGRLSAATASLSGGQFVTVSTEMHAGKYSQVVERLLWEWEVTGSIPSCAIL